ncbi:dockerin type I domain-containing protein [Aeoliella sp.]|uniref:dockerin type I domain-containing protein n=1 Tax=Aeoliella sp. TaxID=2795800 RepID=UPI003CCC23B1
MFRILLLGWLLFPAVRLEAAYVQPMMGGGQVSQGEAGMKHADISFEAGVLSVHVDETVATPVLRALDEPAEFDPAGTWGMINQHAYNFQYGWNPGVFDVFPPDGTWVWIEQLDASPELQVYQRPPASPVGQPIFGTDGSSPRWRWSLSMTHNLYAVQSPQQSEYFAEYRVYIGDDTTGEPDDRFTPAEVTFRFQAIANLPGDYDNSGVVDAEDYALWRNEFSNSVTPGTGADGNGDGLVNLADYTVWRNQLGASTIDSAHGTISTAAVPEPAAVVTSLLALVLGARFRRGVARRLFLPSLSMLLGGRPV